MILTYMPVATFAQEETPVQSEQEIPEVDANSEEVSVQIKNEIEEASEEEAPPAEEEISQPENEPEVSEQPKKEDPEEAPLEVKSEEQTEDTSSSEELPSIYFTASGGDYDEGDNVSYKAVHILPQNHGDDYMEIAYFTFPNDSDAMGTCAQLGVDFASSGTAQVDRRISNSTRLAKVIYDLVYVKKYLELPERDKTIYGVVPGVISSTVWTRGYLVECACQIDIMGRSTYLNIWGSSMSTPEPVADWYANYNISNINVPDNFEIYYCNAGSHQNFVFWKYAKNSYVRVHKVSSTTIPDSESGNYSLKNAKYYLYDTKAHAEAAIAAALAGNTIPSAGRIKDTDGNNIELVTGENGNSQVVEIEPGTYWAAEIKASKGFKLDETARSVTCTTDNKESNPATINSTEVPYTYAYLKKKANVEVSGSDYSLAGAKYWIYDTQAHAEAAIAAAIAGNTIPTTGRVKDDTGNNIELETDANGNTQSVKLNSGKTYWAAEIKASKGFKLDDQARSATVNKSNLESSPAEFVSIETADTYLYIKKAASRENYSHPENYTLAGAKYWLYDSEAHALAAISAAKAGSTIPEDGRVKDDDGKTLELVTDAEGNTQLAKVKAGTYYAAEVQASDYYLIDENANSVTVTKDNIKSNPALINSTEIPQTGYFTLKKEAAQTNTDFLNEAPNNYELENATFEVYVDPDLQKKARDVDNNVITLTTDSNGLTSKYKVDVGDYWAKEVVAPKGYKLPRGEHAVHMITVETDGSNDENNPAVFEFTDDPTYGEPEIKLIKFDSKGIKDWSRLTGAYYQLSYYDIRCDYGDETNPDPKSINYGTPTRKWIFKTRKVTSDDPTIFWAGWDWQNDEVVSSVLLDAPVTTAGGIKYKSGDTIKSDPFYTENGKRILPIGFYTIEEIKAPVGVSRNPLIVHGKIYQPAMGQEAEDYKDNKAIRVDYDEVPQNVTIAIQKVDAETGENKPQGGATAPAVTVMNVVLQALSDSGVVLDERLASFGSLAGAVYNVYFNNDEVRIPEIVGQIVTDENGYGELTKRTLGRFKDRGQDLEPGDYYIEEVSASPGYVIDKYVLDGTNTVEVSDHEIEVICDYDEDGEPVTKTIGGTFESEELTGKVNYTGDVDNEVAVDGKINSRHIFKARAQSRNSYMFKFTMTSKESPHITEISKTDITTCEELPGATLQIINSDGEVVMNWVSTTEPHIIKALPSGTYTLREITAPYGYDIAEDVQFTVVDDVIYNKVEMKNKPLNVATHAVDAATKAHQGIFAAEETITDSVKVSGLYAGRTYKVGGVLMNKLTGEAIKDAEGNPLVAESEPFVATGDEMEVQVNFTVDSSLFTTDSIVVVFEKLYRIERIEGRDETNDFPGEEFPVELAKHEDLEDEEQSIHYGGIVGTVATDAASKSHNILADKDVTIVDVVEYKNLAPANEYEVKGELYDKTTGQLLGVTGSAKFTPETPDGTVEVTFTFDASELKNHDLVAFEELYINGILINDHKNPDDEEQTVHVPEIYTTATDSETMSHVSYADDEITIVDAVEYRNLIPGEEYVMNGVLMNKETGEPLLADGKEVTASTTFTPAEKDGVVDVVFTFSGIELAGTTTVAFEDCTINGVAVAVHADLEDEAQSVDIPYIGTTAALVKKHVEDTVEYTNLAPGKYVMRGWLVNHKNGKKLIDSDGETEFEITEPHASGEVVVDLPIKGYNKLGGYSLTAFEELYYVAEIVEEDGTVTEQEVLVADHTDRNDKDQTVKIPGVKTGDTNKLYLFVEMFILLVSACGIYYFKRRKRN